jgi:hypothetical protein
VDVNQDGLYRLLGLFLALNPMMNEAQFLLAERRTWLIMLISLIAGLLFASAVTGQEYIYDTNPLTGERVIVGYSGGVAPPSNSPGSTASPANVAPRIPSQEAAPAIVDSVLTDPAATGFPPAGDVVYGDIGSGQVVNTKLLCGKIKTVCVLPQDEIWLISARDSHLSPCNPSPMSCSQLRCGEWHDASLEALVELHASDKSKVTMIYTHGNRTNLSWAKSRGLQFYGNAIQPTVRPPIRFVIFAWMSEAVVPRVLTDFKIKSNRSLDVGLAFGKLLGKFNDRQIVLGGFSLGAQVILQGVADPELQDGRLGRYRIALFAPALDPNYVQCGLHAFPHSSIVESTDVFVNRNDRAIQMTQLIARRRTHAHVSYLEELAQCAGHTANLIRVHDITAEVTKKHSIVEYSDSMKLKCRLAETLGFHYKSIESVPAASDSSVLVAPPMPVE